MELRERYIQIEQLALEVREEHKCRMVYPSSICPSCYVWLVWLQLKLTVYNRCMGAGRSQGWANSSLWAHLTALGWGLASTPVIFWKNPWLFQGRGRNAFKFNNTFWIGLNRPISGQQNKLALACLCVGGGGVGRILNNLGNCFYFRISVLKIMA